MVFVYIKMRQLLYIIVLGALGLYSLEKMERLEVSGKVAFYLKL